MTGIGSLDRKNGSLVIRALDLSGSIADGPGVRGVLYVQGCHGRCRGCHNPSTWNPEDGRIIPVDALAGRIRRECPARRLTISGGEPLLQAGAVLDLCRRLDGFDLCLYTSFELESVPAELLDRLRYLKVGPYVEAERTSVIPYVGSTNQRFLKLREAAA